MQARPVAAAHPSLFNIAKRLLGAIFALSLFLLSQSVTAQLSASEPEPYSLSSPSPSYLARIGFNDPAQLSEALDRVQEFYENNGEEIPLAPISIVVHGPEVHVFEKDNYDTYKSIVDKAAQLTALGALDLAVCETRLEYEGVKMQDVYPFVDTVPFGPTEIDRLLHQENYLYF